jgi:4-amino-4-deoxy-L-arabinose transferase-like glycosyltransferase
VRWLRAARLRAPCLVAAAAALAALAAGIRWGTFAIGGSDSYCYASQADMIARGRTRVDQPLAPLATWRAGAASFVPAGHRLAAGGSGAVVPICPAGLPALLAAASVLGGRDAVFYVAPVFGAAAVWLTFLLGVRLGSGAAGAAAAVLVASSPILLYQIVQPMSDVPAAACWLAAVVLLTRGGWRSAAIGGLAAGLAILIRPNLVGVGAVAGLFALVDPAGSARSPDPKRGLAFLLGLAPGCAGVGLAQLALYGSPLRSGYGEVEGLFSTANVLPNLQRYAWWMLDTHTPMVLIALAAPLAVGPSIARDAGRRRYAVRLSLAVSMAVLVSYLPYHPFAEWWYLRFLLPALPLLLVLAAWTLLVALARVPYGVGPVLMMFLTAVVAAHSLQVARERSAFRLWRLEERFAVAGRYVSRKLPPRAVVLTVAQSGSIRHYAGRPTLLWDTLDPGELDEALARLSDAGWQPFLLFEADEAQAFRRRFAGHAVGAVDWPPRAEIRTEVPVTIYDVADRARYLAGENVRPERVWPDRR